MPGLMISRCDHPGSTVLTVTGEIDICTAPDLEAALQQVPLTDLILDLSAVGFLGAVGLRLIVDTRHRLHTRHHRLVVVESPHVPRLTRITGLCAPDPPLHTVPARADAQAVEPHLPATAGGAVPGSRCSALVSTPGSDDHADHGGET